MLCFNVKLRVSLLSFAGNTKGGSITVPLTSCLSGLDQPVLQIKTKIVSSHTADSKPVKQEVNGTVILPPLVFPDSAPKASLPLALASTVSTKISEECFGNINKPQPNFIKLFTVVIYRHSIVIPSFCVIKQHYLGKYCRMAVNYCGICVNNAIAHNLN